MVTLSRRMGQYFFKYNNDILFYGTYSEIIAYGLWTLGIQKSETIKALNLLDKIEFVKFNGEKIDHNEKIC